MGCEPRSFHAGSEPLRRCLSFLKCDLKSSGADSVYSFLLVNVDGRVSGSAPRDYEGAEDILGAGVVVWGVQDGFLVVGFLEEVWRTFGVVLDWYC